MNTRLNRELVADTSLWRLYLRLSGEALHALLIGPESVERSVIARCEPLADGSMQALENAVYDNPLLLGDFASVTISVDTSQFFLVPPGLDALNESMAETMLPDYSEPRRLLDCECGPLRLVAAVEAERLNFLRRTFAQASFTHSLAAAATWLAHRNRRAADSAHLYALCGPSALSVVAFNAHGEPSLVNRFEHHGAADCAYFILAAAGADPMPLTVSGAPSLRNDVCARLREAMPGSRVLPMTLPSELLHLRHNAPAAPDDLLFLTQL